MHTLVDALNVYSERMRERRSLTLCLCKTNRDVIFDDGINYWRTPISQLFTVLINSKIFLPRPSVMPLPNIV